VHGGLAVHKTVPLSVIAGLVVPRGLCAGSVSAVDGENAQVVARWYAAYIPTGQLSEFDSVTFLTRYGWVILPTRSTIDHTLALPAPKRPRLSDRRGRRLLCGWTEERLTDLVRRLSLHGRGHVAIQVGKQSRIGMPEPFGGDLGWDAAGQH
jgi:hypothetical protein